MGSERLRASWYKSQNLRDQGSRIEKIDANDSASNVQVNGLDTDAEESTISNISSSTSSETIDENCQQNQNANETTLDTDLHTAQRPQPQLPEDTSPTIEVNYSTGENASIEVPGCLPKYKAIETPRSFNWGLSHHGKTITVLTSTIDKAYDEISQWRKNTFLVPYCRTERDFIDKLTEHINDWNNGAEGQHVSLKAAIVLLAVGLQKPSRKSKAKDHQECLAKRLALWKEGDIDSLLREGRAIQRRLTSSKRAEQPNKAKVFANLVMRGQIHSALRCLCDDNGGGVLPLSDDVMNNSRKSTRRHRKPA